MRFREHQSPGSILSFFRTRAGLTQPELAERAGIAAVNLNLLERGARHASDAEHLAIAEALALDERDAARLRKGLRMRSPYAKVSPIDKFTERARKVLTLAQEEAQRFNHNYIGTEHLLLGLVREGDGVAARVLGNMGVQLPKVRSAVEFIIGRGEGAVVGDIGLTPRAKKVIELAVDEARRLNHHYIGTEHLLLGLVREGEGIAAGVLESLGVNLEKVRAQVMQVIDPSSAGTSKQEPKSGSLYLLGLETARTFARVLETLETRLDEIHAEVKKVSDRIADERASDKPS